MLRKIIWFIAVAGWCSVICYGVVNWTPAAIMGCVVSAIGTWVVMGGIQSHLLGIRRHVLAHVDFPLAKGQLIKHVVHPRDRVDIQRALDYFVQNGSRAQALFGVGANYHADLGQLLASDTTVSPLEWESRRCSVHDWHECVASGVYLLFLTRPVVVLFEHHTEANAVPTETSDQMKLEVYAQTREIGRNALDSILKRAKADSIYRGAVISLRRADRKADRFEVAFHDLDTIARDEIILPENVLEVIDRSVLGFLRHSQVLKRAKRSQKHGVLFHGPPGTGKTLATKYLAGQCKDYTILLVTGWQLSLVRETFAMARQLAPALIILEDVDLIATRRRRNQNKTMLHELLDELDGVANDSDTITLMTTNNPKALEPALAMRPGRVDQAIQFPLPDESCRERLLALFGTGIVLKIDVQRWVQKTAGASPAFLRELLRKAVLFAAERDEQSKDLVRMIDDDLENAMRELVLFGGNLTQKLLGFQSNEA